jgi:hypothetical protein
MFSCFQIKSVGLEDKNLTRVFVLEFNQTEIKSYQKMIKLAKNVFVLSG